MIGNGSDIITIGSTRVGQRYVFGADVPLDNAAWKGPWDCAEFASWCVYQAYGVVMGAGRPRRIGQAEPYSGHWWDETKDPDIAIDVEDALRIAGAILIRKPRKSLIGHVAISMGDGERTLEARSRTDGVGIFTKAATRPWDRGALVPGVEYGFLGGILPPSRPTAKPTPLPPGFLALARPLMKGPEVFAVQRALAAANIDAGPLDGEFGALTDAAVMSFQIERGLEVDGIVGPNTAAALGLGFPVPPTAADVSGFAAARTSRPAAGSIDVPPPAESATADLVASVALQSGSYVATTARGVSFRFAKRVSYRDDMARVGLNQGGKSLQDTAKFGSYAAVDFAAVLGQWAHFILPTLTAEGAARYATLNTYDRAAFTFGAPQLAAHTPDRNFGPYLRRLLELPEAAEHFPELSLRKNARGVRTVHLRIADGSFRNLEESILVTRPNGQQDRQAIHLMRYLNADPTEVDGAETLAAARLINWLRQDRRVALLQIETFIEMAKLNFQIAQNKMPDFDPANWQMALWVMDIMHQGRGTFSVMNRALQQASPVEALSRIGATAYSSRIKTVKAGVAALEASGVMQGFHV